MEEEIFGRLYHVNLEQGTWVVTIDPPPPAPYLGSMQVADISLQQNAGTANWGWYGLGGWGAPCDPGPSSDSLEHHYPDVDAGRELHCVEPGRYTITLTHNEDTIFSRVVDFGSYPNQVVGAGHTWLISHYQSGDAGANRYFNTPDVILDYDAEATPPPGGRSSWAAQLDVSIAEDTLAPWDSAVTTSTLHVPQNMWLRVSAARTATDDRVYVTRFFWNGLSDTSDATGYGNPYLSGNHWARARQLTSQGESRSVVAVVQPAGGTSVANSLAIQVDSPMVAVASVPTAARKDSLVNLSAVSTSGATAYLWDFGDGSSSGWITSASTSHAWASVGTFRVKLSVRNVSHAVARDTSHLVEIVDPPPLVGEISGIDLISESGTYEWQQSATGGVSPYTYGNWYYFRWPGSYSLVGSGEYYSRYVATEATEYVFTLRAHVTDSQGSQDPSYLLLDVLGTGGKSAVSVDTGVRLPNGGCGPRPTTRQARQAWLWWVVERRRGIVETCTIRDLR